MRDTAGAYPARIWLSFYLQSLDTGTRKIASLTFCEAPPRLPVEAPALRKTWRGEI